MITAAATEEEMLQGFALGREAIRIIETHPVPPEVACPVYNFYASHIIIWHRPLIEAQQYLNAAISKGLQTYDLTWTTVAAIDRAVFALFGGESLDLVQAKLEEAEPVIRKGKQGLARHWLSMPMHLVQNLRGLELAEDDPAQSTSTLIDVLHTAELNQLHTYLFGYHFYGLVGTVFTGRLNEGMSFAKACEKYLPSATGSFMAAMYMFYSAVLFVDNSDNLVHSELALLQKKMNLLRLWAKTSPATFEHKFKFLEVMMSRNENNQLATLDSFDEAIYLALEAGLIHDAALYAERCSRWLSRTSPNRAAQYLSFARRQYDFWGATSKVQEISALQPPAAALRGFGISTTIY